MQLSSEWSYKHTAYVLHIPASGLWQKLLPTIRNQIKFEIISILYHYCIVWEKHDLPVNISSNLFNQWCKLILRMKFWEADVGKHWLWMWNPDWRQNKWWLESMTRSWCQRERIKEMYVMKMNESVQEWS